MSLKDLMKWGLEFQFKRFRREGICKSCTVPKKVKEGCTEYDKFQCAEGEQKRMLNKNV